MPIGTIIWRTVVAACLLSLFFIAFNFFGWMFWVAGFFIMLRALAHLIGELRKTRRVPLIVIALATVALFWGACANHVRAFGHLSKDTRAFAVEMHERCNRDRTCPPVDAVCTPEAYRCRETGSLGVRFGMRYRVREDKQSFTVTSSMSTDDATVYEGGVARALIRTDEMDGQPNGPGTTIVPYDAGVLQDAGGPSDAGAP